MNSFLISTSSLSSASTKQRLKIGTTTAKEERKEQAMAERMIASESGKQQTFTVF